MSNDLKETRNNKQQPMVHKEYRLLITELKKLNQDVARKADAIKSKLVQRLDGKQ